MPYQEAGASFLASLPRAGLFDDMGLGKTAQTIRALDIKGAVKGMIVCPASFRQGWVGEFAKFSTTYRRIVKGLTIHDFKAWQRGLYDVIVVSYEMAAKWAPLVAADFMMLDFIILDESHYLKSPTAVRTRRILGPDSAGDGLTQWAENVYYLSGTPVPNDPIDIHTFLYSSGAVGLNLNEFRRKYFISHARTYSPAHEVNPEHVGELKDIISRFSIRRTLATAGLELPDIFITDTVIDGDTSAVRDMLIQHPGLDSLIVQVLEQGSGLSGITIDNSGHIATLRRLIGEAKALPYAKMLLEELHGGTEKAVVFGIHTQCLRMAKDYLESQGIKCVAVTGEVKEDGRVRNMKEFQEDSDFRVFFGNIRAAGVALTLTAANRIDMLESDWTPAGNAQAIKRVHRISQKKNVLARFITLARSFDEVVNEIVAEKTRRIAAIDEVGAMYAGPV